MAPWGPTWQVQAQQIPLMDHVKLLGRPRKVGTMDVYHVMVCLGRF